MYSFVFVYLLTNISYTYSVHISKSERHYNAKSVLYHFLGEDEYIARFSYLH